MILNETRTNNRFCGYSNVPVVRNFRIALLVIVVLQFFLTSEINAYPYQRTLRLCSRSLSDALFLVCKGRGFNEPFSYSGEENDDEERRPVSSNTNTRRSGLVQECCHRSCSIEHLERYCKPLPPQPSIQEDSSSRGNAIASKSTPVLGKYKIINLPYSSVKKFEIASVTLASTTNRGRKKKVKKIKKGHGKICGCRREKRLRNKWRKVSRETVIPKVPDFQVGTTSPEPIDRIVIFPFKSELSLERINGNVQGLERNDLNRSYIRR